LQKFIAKIIISLYIVNRVAFTLIINQQMHYIKFHIKTLKIALACFNPKIILRELCCSLLVILKTFTK